MQIIFYFLLVLIPISHYYKTSYRTTAAVSSITLCGSPCPVAAFFGFWHIPTSPQHKKRPLTARDGLHGLWHIKTRTTARVIDTPAAVISLRLFCLLAGISFGVLCLFGFLCGFGFLICLCLSTSFGFLGVSLCLFHQNIVNLVMLFFQPLQCD